MADEGFRNINMPQLDRDRISIGLAVLAYHRIQTDNNFKPIKEEEVIHSYRNDYIFYACVNNAVILLQRNNQ